MRHIEQIGLIKLRRYIGLSSATSKESKGYHVTRRYSLMPKRKNVKNASNVLIDVELFTLDMKFRLLIRKLVNLKIKFWRYSRYCIYASKTTRI